MAYPLPPPTEVDGTTLESNDGILSVVRPIPAVPSIVTGQSDSGVAATEICTLEASEGNRLWGWVVFCEVPSNLRIVVTYGDDSTANFGITANGTMTCDGTFVTVTGGVTPGALPDLDTKTVKKIRVETSGTGVSMREAAIVAWEVPA